MLGGGQSHARGRSGVAFNLKEVRGEGSSGFWFISMHD